jgi:hypothetical protein
MKYTWQNNSVLENQSGVSNASQYCKSFVADRNGKEKYHMCTQNEHT